MTEVGSILPSVLKLEETMEAGSKALREGLWKEALRLFQTATELKPQYIDPWLRKALAFRGMGDLRGAVDSYRKALEIDPASKDAWMGLIEVLHDLGKYKQEIETCDCLLRLSPRSDDVLLNKGVALHLLGKLEAALECFTQVAERRPDKVAALNNIGAILLKLDRLEEALEAFDSALALEPQHGEVQRNRCLLLLRLGRYSEAVRAAEQMLAVEEEGWLWMLMGLAHAELKEIPLALQCLERAKQIDSTLEGLDEAMDKARRLNDAMETAEEKLADEAGQREFEAQGIALETPQVDPQGIAVLLNHLGYPTESLRIWQQSMDKERAEDWLGLGRALIAGGEKRSGERCLEEAAKRMPQRDEKQEISMQEIPSLWREISSTDSDGGIDEAIELLSRVLEHHGDLEYGWVWLGVLRALENRLVGSEAALRQSVDIRPDCATAWSNLGAVLAQLCRLNEASAALRKALEMDPNHMEAMHNLGFVEWRQGNYDEARKTLRMAVRIDERPQTWLVLACVMENMSRWREALHCYEKVLALEPKNSMAMAGIGRARGRIGSIRKSFIDKSSKRLAGMPGVGPTRARILVKAGYASPRAIAEAQLDDLAKLPGFTMSAAIDLRKSLRQARMKSKPRKSPGK